MGGKKGQIAQCGAAYEKKDSQLLSNLGHADAALKTMKGIGMGHKQLRAEIPPFLTL